MTKKKQPELVEDNQLDEASGGMLLPAIQKVRDAANRSSSAQSSNNLKQMGVGVVNQDD